MSFPTFFLRLLIYTSIAVIFHLLFSASDLFSPYSRFSILIILFFIILCKMFYFIGSIVARSKNIYLFNNLISLIVLTKMILCSLLVFIYFKKAQPPDKYFVVPFFTYYIIYTVFELDFMSRLARK